MKRSTPSSPSAAGRKKKAARIGRQKFPIDAVGASAGSPLPDDVIEEIMARLPSKSLCCFRLVCKRWLALTKDARFAAAHASRAASSQILIFQKGGKFGRPNTEDAYRYTIGRDSNSNAEWSELYMNYEAELIGSCNGLLCVLDKRVKGWEAVMLVNPCIPEIFTLPPVQAPCRDCGCRYGFGHVPETNTYAIAFYTTYECDGRIASRVMVYTIGKDTAWRTIEIQPHPWVLLDMSICVDGCIFWRTSLWPFAIYAFDLTTERFTKMEFPPWDRNPELYLSKKMMEIDNKLHVVRVGNKSHVVETQFCDNSETFKIRGELWSWHQNKHWSGKTDFEITRTRSKPHCPEALMRLSPEDFIIHDQKLWCVDPQASKLCSSPLITKGSNRSRPPVNSSKLVFPTCIGFVMRMHKPTLISPKSLCAAGSSTGGSDHRD